MPATYKHITTELTLHNEQFAIKFSLLMMKKVALIVTQYKHRLT